MVVGAVVGVVVGTVVGVVVGSECFANVTLRVAMEALGVKHR